MTTCTGDGDCLIQIGIDKYEINPGCDHACTPVSCPRCKSMCQKWILDCHVGYCMNCAIDLFSIYGKLGLPFTGKDSESYVKFMNFMKTMYSEYGFVDNSVYSKELFSRFVDEYVVDSPGDKLYVLDICNSYAYWYVKNINKDENVYYTSDEDLASIIGSLPLCSLVQYNSEDDIDGFIADKKLLTLQENHISI